MIGGKIKGQDSFLDQIRNKMEFSNDVQFTGYRVFNQSQLK